MDDWYKSENLWAVNEVSFSILPNKIFGLIEESGSGKTTVGGAILNAAPIILFTEMDALKSFGRARPEGGLYQK